MLPAVKRNPPSGGPNVGRGERRERPLERPAVPAIGRGGKDSEAWMNRDMRVIRERFIDDHVRGLFQQNRLRGFADLWHLDAPWVEAPNERRRGTSGVFRYPLEAGDGAVQPVFVKRQSNHNTKTCRHPIRGVPTFLREYRYIRELRQAGIPVVDVWYYGQAVSGGVQHAILVTRALEGYVSLDQWFALDENRNDDGRVRAVLRSVVDAVKPIHARGIGHGSLYGKHIFVRTGAGDDAAGAAVAIRLIDLERARRSLFHDRLIRMDLSQLLRRTPGLGEKEREILLALYFDAPDRGRWRIRLRKAIETKTRRKRR